MEGFPGPLAQAGMESRLWRLEIGVVWSASVLRSVTLTILFKLIVFTRVSNRKSGYLES